MVVGYVRHSWEVAEDEDPSSGCLIPGVEVLVNSVEQGMNESQVGAV